MVWLITVPLWIYLKKSINPAQADVAITIFGRGCGTVRTEFEMKAKFYLVDTPKNFTLMGSKYLTILRLR